MSADIPVIDLERLYSITAGDAQLEHKLFSLFNETANRCLAQLETSPSTSDWEKVLHELKGAAASLGANRVAGSCEEAGRSRQIDPLKQELTAIQQHLSRNG